MFRKIVFMCKVWSPCEVVNSAHKVTSHLCEEVLKQAEHRGNKPIPCHAMLAIPVCSVDPRAINVVSTGLECIGSLRGFLAPLGCLLSIPA